jgi:hypothetical protein
MSNDTTPSVIKHLWEVDHPYYCNLGNYFDNNCGREYACWDEFLSEFGDSDMDMNLLFRWDWKVNTDDDGTPIPNADPYYRDGTLEIFWMGQRKGIYQFSTVQVCKADEPRVIEFLRPRLMHLLSLWEPMNLSDSH